MSKALCPGLKVSVRADVLPNEGVAVPRSRYKIFRSFRFARCKWRALDFRLKMVDLVGIEPTTSSMPWNDENSNLLTAEALIVGRVGKNR